MADSSNYTVENISRICQTKYINAEPWSSISLKMAILKINGMKFLHSISNISRNVVVAKVPRGYWNKKWITLGRQRLFVQWLYSSWHNGVVREREPWKDEAIQNNWRTWLISLQKRGKKKQTFSFWIQTCIPHHGVWERLLCYQSSNTGFLIGSGSTILHVIPCSARPNFAHFHQHR